MPKEKAKKLATRLNRQKDGIVYKARHQHWREGNNWYVKGSDGSGTFEGV